jgi:hypothetical protein
MRDAVVFNSANFLGFQDIRANVIRIPQVISRIREAQLIWDRLSHESLDLLSFLISDDVVFLSHIKRKQLLTAIVQVGLWDRYLASNARPEYVVGVVNGDSPLKVALNQQTFFDMVAESPALNSMALIPSLKLMSTDLPVLAGVQLEEHGMFVRQSNDTYERVASELRDVEKMILSLVQTKDLSKVTVVGPGHYNWSQRVDLTSPLETCESIESDPMLAWFWPQVSGDRVIAAAN